ncbi:MAG TPA: hypothetical protein VF068_10885 [Rubrobacter sp.]
MKVLIAIEPRSYREAIGEAIQRLRPHLMVAIVEPEDLFVEVGRFEPELVFADRPDTLQSAGRCGWVEFRPYEEPPAKINLGGSLRELKEIDLPVLLSVVDEADELARTS